MQKHFRLLALAGIVLLMVFAYINRLNIIGNFQITRLKTLKCPDALKHIPSKLWVHAVNSIKKYQQLENDFSGFECDLTYIDSLDAFFIFHPPATGDEKNLPWKTFAEAVDLKKKRLYLDMRGVNKMNAQKAYKTFVDQFDTTTLKNQTIIELYDYPAAFFFQDKGFNVTLSYTSLADEFDLSKKNTLDSVSKIITAIPQLSGDIIRLKEMKEQFPGKKYLVWNLSFKNYINTTALCTQIQDTSLYVILVSIRSKYHR